MERKHYTSLEQFDWFRKWNNFILVQFQKKFGLLDLNLYEVLPCEFSKIDEITFKGYIRAWKLNKCGLFDFQGKMVQPVVFQSIHVSDNYFLTIRNGVVAKIPIPSEQASP